LLARLDATLTDARLASDQVNAIAVTPGQAGDRLPYVAPLAARFELVWDRPVARVWCCWPRSTRITPAAL
jgi:hypothetical protein